ncbi:hypothetical protein V6N13_081374 [Hibiscus sabdariffa]
MGSTSQVSPNQPFVIPDFPHSLFGSVTIVPRAMDPDFPIGGLWGWHPSNNVTEDVRTLFLTFSRGFLFRNTKQGNSSPRFELIVYIYRTTSPVTNNLCLLEWFYVPSQMSIKF